MLPDHQIRTAEFEPEDWHVAGGGGVASSNGTLKEVLLRCTDQDGETLPPKQLADHYYNKGQAVLFDVIVVSLALADAKAKEHFPVSINIAPQSAHSEEFWGYVDTVMEGLKPQDVVFELLEHAVPKDADLTLLQQKREQGYRFALDDITTDKRSFDRLKFYGAVVDFVKIDGKAVRQGLDNSDILLKGLTSAISKTAPQAEVIAEHVETHAEASLLQRAFGTHFVQGRKLLSANPSTTPALQLVV
jgi:EAL domain-containing protein (putative c-di-GMP-specific phosphodiesterase class I)